MQDNITGVISLMAGTQSHLGKSTLKELELLEMSYQGIPLDCGIEIEASDRLVTRLKNSVAGRSLAEVFTVHSPIPPRQTNKDDPKAIIRHHNTLWPKMKQARVSTLDMAGMGTVYKDFSEWWIDADIRTRCAEAGKVVQGQVVLNPTQESIGNALRGAKVMMNSFLPANGKLFIVFNEKDNPNGFKEFERYAEYMELVELCEKGLATAIHLKACRSAFIGLLKHEQISLFSLLEIMAASESPDPAQRARFAEYCRLVGIDPEDEIAVDDEKDALLNWLGDCRKEVRKLIHPAMHQFKATTTVAAAE